MKKIAIVFLLFAVVLSCDPQVEEVKEKTSFLKLG